MDFKSKFLFIIARNNSKMKIENPAGDALEEISAQNFMNVSGAGVNSKKKGNQGAHCSWSIECQRICEWVSWGPKC
ncbi:MAG: plantaricin C family lantibiotic [Clostridiales bacterium]